MTWKVGDRVRNKPEEAHLYAGTQWEAKLSLPRLGTVIELPMAIRETGLGTMLVKWDSLTGDNDNTDLWQRWMHSDRVERVA